MWLYGLIPGYSDRPSVGDVELVCGADCRGQLSLATAIVVFALLFIGVIVFLGYRQERSISAVVERRRRLHRMQMQLSQRFIPLLDGVKPFPGFSGTPFVITFQRDRSSMRTIC